MRTKREGEARSGSAAGAAGAGGGPGGEAPPVSCKGPEGWWEDDAPAVSCAACGEPFGAHGLASGACPVWKPEHGGRGVFRPRRCERPSCGHIEAAHADASQPFAGVCMLSACDCHEFASPGRFECSPGASTIRSVGVGDVSGSPGAAGSRMPMGQARTGCPACDSLPEGQRRAAHALLHSEPTCLGTPPVEGCYCGAFVDVRSAHDRHQAKVTTAATRSSPASTIGAMAGALAELATFLANVRDRTTCARLARELRDLAARLPAEDGGREEVRHA